LYLLLHCNGLNVVSRRHSMVIVRPAEIDGNLSRALFCWPQSLVGLRL